MYIRRAGLKKREVNRILRHFGKVIRPQLRITCINCLKKGKFCDEYQKK